MVRQIIRRLFKRGWGVIPLLVSFAIGLPGKADNYSGWLQWANLMPGWLLYTIWYVLVLLTAIWVVSVFDHWLEQRSTLIRLGDVVSSKLKGNAEEYPEGTVVTEIRQLALNGDIVLFGKKNPNEKIFHRNTTPIGRNFILVGLHHRAAARSGNDDGSQRFAASQPVALSHARQTRRRHPARTAAARRLGGRSRRLG